MSCNKVADVGCFHKAIKMIGLLGVLMAIGAFFCKTLQKADNNYVIQNIEAAIF